MWSPTYILEHFSNINTCVLILSIKIFGNGNTINIILFKKKRKKKKKTRKEIISE